MKTKRQHKDNLTKRCDCGARKQLTCAHPWYLDVYRGKRYRFSLDVIAKDRGEKPPRTKGDAEALRDRLRGEIRANAFKDPHAKVEPPSTPVETRLTVSDVAKRYLNDYVNVPTRRERAAHAIELHLDALTAAEIPAANGETIRLGAKAVADVTTDDIEAIRRGRREAMKNAIADRTQWEHDAAERAADGKPTERAKPRLMVKGGETGINRLLARARHFFNWAIEQGIVDHTPFKRHGVTVIRLAARAEKRRHRRLVPDVLDENGQVKAPGEERRLLAAAGPHLQGLIIAALETGCRVGELLSLQWQEVEFTTGPKGELIPKTIILPAEKTKTYETREIPVTARLAAVLEMRRLDPKGKPMRGTAYVFGNEVGEQVASIKTAWYATCRRARIDGLHFHDLRREFASRVRETPGNTDHEVRDLLGHASISTTSRYLGSTPETRERAMKRFERHQRGSLPTPDISPEPTADRQTSGAKTMASAPSH